MGGVYLAEHLGGGGQGGGQAPYSGNQGEHAGTGVGQVGGKGGNPAYVGNQSHPAGGGSGEGSHVGGANPVYSGNWAGTRSVMSGVGMAR